MIPLLPVLPVAVVVVGHDVHEVKMLVQLGEVVASRYLLVKEFKFKLISGPKVVIVIINLCTQCYPHLFIPGADSGTKKVAHGVQPLGELPDERAEVVLVVLGVRPLEEARVLPVKVHAVEAELEAELDARVDEGLALLRVGRHRGEVSRPRGPST